MLDAEWLIIDYARFDGGKPGPGTLTVVDQIPGFVATEDVTYMLLQQGCKWSRFCLWW